MRSDSVVLPESMCAEIPMLRILSSLLFATSFDSFLHVLPGRVPRKAGLPSTLASMPKAPDGLHHNEAGRQDNPPKGRWNPAPRAGKRPSGDVSVPRGPGSPAGVPAG